MQNSIKDREFDKFRDANGQSKVAVTLEGDTGLIEGISYDKITASYPTNSTELYSYFLNSVLQAQVLVTYSNSSKTIFVSSERV